MPTPILKTYGIETEGAYPPVSPILRTFGIELFNVEKVNYVGIHGNQIRAGTINGGRFTGTAVAFKDFVSVLHLVGAGTVAYVNGLTPAYGDAYTVTDAGTINSQDAVAGDIWEWSGTEWVKMVTGSGGFVPSGTRAVLSTQTTLIGPYTDSSDDGKVFLFDGTDLVGADTEQGHEGAALFIEPSGASTFAAKGYFLNAATPSGVWTRFTPDASELIQFTCTATEEVNNLVYISAANTVSQADASAVATARVIGWIQSKLNSTTCLVSRAPGPVTSSGLTAGSPVYLSNTAGAASATEGTVIVELGIAKSTTSFIFTGARITA